jgi:uncharacterized membrane protein YkvA (DUF1232 family)
MGVDKDKNLGGLDRFQGFYESLTETIDEYHGEYSDIVRHCPRFFRLLCKIINDKYTDWSTKLMIDAALAYFVLPEDIIPDKEEAGYVDDLFIVCHVLKEIKDKVSVDLIESNWDGEEDIITLVDVVYEKSSRIVARHTLEILRKVGLQKYQTLNLAEYSGTYTQKLAKLGNEKRELLALLAFLVKKLYHTNVRGWRVDQIKEFLEQHGDFDEIHRLIEVSKMNHNYTPTTKKEQDDRVDKTKKEEYGDIDSQLRAARMKALVEDDVEDTD